MNTCVEDGLYASCSQSTLDRSRRDRRERFFIASEPAGRTVPRFRSGELLLQDGGATFFTTGPVRFVLPGRKRTPIVASSSRGSHDVGPSCDDSNKSHKTSRCGLRGTVCALSADGRSSDGLTRRLVRSHFSIHLAAPSAIAGNRLSRCGRRSLKHRGHNPIQGHEPHLTRASRARFTVGCFPVPDLFLGHEDRARRRGTR